MSIQVKEVAFVFHAVKNVPAARKFYEELLGLKVGMEVELSPGRWWIEYDVAGVAVGISNAMPARTSSSLVLEVADLDAALAAARAAGWRAARTSWIFRPVGCFKSSILTATESACTNAKRNPKRRVRREVRPHAFSRVARVRQTKFHGHPDYSRHKDPHSRHHR